MTLDVPPVGDIRARACWPCSATRSIPITFLRQAISPTDSPAGKFLQERGVQPKDFNSYGSRRGNDLVMARGTFANIRLKNLLIAPKEGYLTKYFPDGAEMPIFDAAMKYQREGHPAIILAGKEYGAGSSRDWAAKGPICRA